MDRNPHVRKWLVVGIILLFVGVTLAPTINFNTVKASQQNEIKERINQRELLFQTIVDMVNNKEIQRIILKSQMSKGIFPTSEFPVVTKYQIRQMYFIGLILSKIISKSRIQSILQKHQIPDSNIKLEINTVIVKNASLSTELSHLSKLNTHINSTFFQILIWIIITSFAFISLVISGIPMFITLSILWLARIIAANHGVKILGDTITYIIETIALISFTIFFVSLVLLWICFGMPGMPYNIRRKIT